MAWVDCGVFVVDLVDAFLFVLGDCLIVGLLNSVG